MQNLVVFSIHQSKLELELCSVNAKDAWATLSIQTVHRVSFDPCDVDRKIQGTDNAVVSICESIFDVVAGSVDEYTRFIPGSRLDPHILVDCAQILQFPAKIDTD